MNTAIGIIVVLGVLIFIHEFGHFIVAKLSGIRVEVFSLGFGPRIVGFKYGDTDYRVSAIPLGGYVKMFGEEPDEDVGDAPDAFSNKPLGIRTAVVSAGPIMNLLFALAFFPIAYMVGIKVPAYLEKRPVVGYVEKDTPAFKAGFKRGDVITAIGDEEVKKWEDLAGKLSFFSGKETVFKVLRGGRVITLKVIVPSSPSIYALGIYPQAPPIIGQVMKNSPAEKAGLKAGDIILSINGKAVSSWYDIGKIINTTKGDVIIKVKRDGEILSFSVTPKVKDNRRIIGIVMASSTVLKKYPFVESIKKGFEKNVELFVLTFKVIGDLFTGRLSLKVLGGPVQIAVVSGEAVKKGLGEFLLLMAFISLQLGILNLLPIPVLDGGYLFFFLIEAIRGKPVPEKVINISLQIGFLLLLLLTIIVTKNDIMRMLGR